VTNGLLSRYFEKQGSVMIGAKSKYTGINGRSKDALRDLDRKSVV